MLFNCTNVHMNNVNLMLRVCRARLISDEMRIAIALKNLDNEQGTPTEIRHFSDKYFNHQYSITMDMTRNMKANFEPDSPRAKTHLNVNTVTGSYGLIKKNHIPNQKPFDIFGFNPDPAVVKARQRAMKDAYEAGDFNDLAESLSVMRKLVL